MLARTCLPFLLASVLSTELCFGQDSAKLKIITVDSLASGNFKDVFSSFFQLAVKDLTGPDKGLIFTSNPYAIMLKHNDSLATYHYYRKYTYLRNLNISLGVKLDSAYHFNGLSIGLNYALINNRDYTIKKQFLLDDLNDKRTRAWFEWNRAINAGISRIGDTEMKAKYRRQYELLVKDSVSNFQKMDSAFQNWVLDISDTVKYLNFRKLVKDPNFSIYKLKDQPYDSLRKIYQNRALWTLGAGDTSYSDGYLPKKIQIISEYLKGLMPPSHNYNLELDLKATLHFSDDTLLANRNISRQLFSFEPGVNFVLNGPRTKQSFFEFKLSGSYSNIWKGLYPKEMQINNTINATLRLLVLDKIWIPLQIKYDTRNHNVFGFLNVTTNFNGLGGLLKSAKSAAK